MPQYIRFFVVCEGDTIIAGQVALCYKEMVYAWYTGSSEKSLKLRPNDLLMWSFITIYLSFFLDMFCQRNTRLFFENSFSNY